MSSRPKPQPTFLKSSVLGSVKTWHSCVQIQFQIPVGIQIQAQEVQMQVQVRDDRERYYFAIENLFIAKVPFPESRPHGEACFARVGIRAGKGKGERARRRCAIEELFKRQTP